MRELRAISFTEREVTNALVQISGKLKKTLPNGTVLDARVEAGPPITIVLPIKDDYGEVTEVAYGEPEVAAALVQYCMDRKIKLPVRGDKLLRIIGGSPTLVIWLPEPPPTAASRPMSRPTGNPRRAQ